MQIYKQANKHVEIPDEAHKAAPQNDDKEENTCDAGRYDKRRESILRL